MSVLFGSGIVVGLGLGDAEAAGNTGQLSTWSPCVPITSRKACMVGISQVSEEGRIPEVHSE